MRVSYWTVLRGKFYLLAIVEVFITFNLKEAPTRGLAIFQAPQAASETLKMNLKGVHLFAFVCTLNEKRRDQSVSPFYQYVPLNTRDARVIESIDLELVQLSLVCLCIQQVSHQRSRGESQ